MWIFLPNDVHLFSPWIDVAISTVGTCFFILSFNRFMKYYYAKSRWLSTKAHEAVMARMRLDLDNLFAARRVQQQQRGANDALETTRILNEMLNNNRLNE